jgi:hypothetical protein
LDGFLFWLICAASRYKRRDRPPRFGPASSLLAYPRAGTIQRAGTRLAGTFAATPSCRATVGKWRIEMKLGLAVIATAALIGTSFPACAEEIGVGVGPAGVTVGESHRDRDRDRDRDVVRDRDNHRDRDTVIIRKGDRDHDRDIDHDRRKVIIDRD